MFKIKCADSIVSEADIAQSAAHVYSFITGVTAPLSLQSTESGIEDSSRYVGSITKDF